MRRISKTVHTYAHTTGAAVGGGRVRRGRIFACVSMSSKYTLARQLFNHRPSAVSIHSHATVCSASAHSCSAHDIDWSYLILAIACQTKLEAWKKWIICERNECTWMHSNACRWSPERMTPDALVYDVWVNFTGDPRYQNALHLR